MTQRKKFCPALYKANDQKGKIAAIELMTSLGYTHLVEEKELYKKGDLIFKDSDDNIFLVEVEVKNVGWEENGFKYDTLHFSYKPKTKSDVFISFNKAANMCFVCKKEDLIKDENIIFKSTRNRANGQMTHNEPFYEIEVANCSLYKKEDSWTEEV